MSKTITRMENGITYISLDNTEEREFIAQADALSLLKFVLRSGMETTGNRVADAVHARLDVLLERRAQEQES